MKILKKLDNSRKGKLLSGAGRRKGYALIIVLFIFPLVFLLAGTIMEKTLVDLRFTNRDLIRKKAFYIAEAGQQAAMYELSACNYSKYTHNSSGFPMATWQKLPITMPDVYEDGEGWRVWEWTPADAHKGFVGDGTPESFRYRVYPPQVGMWIVEVEGYYGDFMQRIEVTGVTEPAFQYALFGNQELSEFTRGANQTIEGKVHSNGNLYFRPSGSTLNIISSNITAGGKMIRYEDAWGRADGGGTVRIMNSAGNYITMEGRSQGATGKGNAYDTDNKLWMDDSSGALARWNGIVLDGSLGGTRLEPPSLEATEEGGYYEQNAGLVIDGFASGMGITKINNFYNPAEDRYEDLIEIDMDQFNYPPNGLIYSKVPVRIVNAAKLPGPLTIVSNSNIYTKGDFNKVYGDKDAFDDGASTKMPAALITSQRLYHLSSGYNDSQNFKGASIKTASDPRLYTGDAVDLLEINAALVDGPPTVDEINYVKQWNGVNNPLYNPVDKPGGKYCWANSDDFIESWSSKTVKKRGSIVHLENAKMAKFDNSDAGPGVTAWAYKTHYVPPVRDYAYDTDLQDPAKQPPFFTLLSRQLLWKAD